MWMCAAEIANRNTPLGEVAGWVGEEGWAGECCLTAVVTAFVFASPLPPSLDSPTSSRSPACLQGKRQHCHAICRGSDPPRKGGHLGHESQSDHWLQCPGSGCCRLVAKSFEDGDDILYTQFLNCLPECLEHGRRLMSVGRMT